MYSMNLKKIVYNNDRNEQTQWGCGNKLFSFVSLLYAQTRVSTLFRVSFV